MKRSWAKGHYRCVLSLSIRGLISGVRKAKALESLGQLEDAQMAVQDGLQFEPENEVRPILWRGVADCPGAALSGTRPDRRKLTGISSSGSFSLLWQKPLFIKRVLVHPSQTLDGHGP